MRAQFVRAMIVVLLFAASGAPVGAQLSTTSTTTLDTSTTTLDTLTPTAETLAKLDPLLLAQLADQYGQSYVIARAADAASLGAVATLIQQAGGSLGRALPILSAQAASIPNASILTLAANPIVQRLALDRLMLGFTERTAATVGVTAVRQHFGYDGSGIGVAVIDSGVTAWHNDLEDRAQPGTQRVDRFVDFIGGQSTPFDDYGHGTHVAGIIAGNGADSDGARAGIAPGARLVVLKVLDSFGRGRISDVIAAIDYAVTHRAEFNIRIINLSVGAGVYESYTTDFLTLAAKRAVEHGIVVVAAGGNQGRNAQGVAQHGAISAPGNAPWVLTVGASSHMGTESRADDTMAAFSSRGPTAVDQLAKPDLVAPGVGIYSLSAPESAMYNTRERYLLPGTLPAPYLPYLSLSGTSQAAPVVAGTVALMLQANPALTPNAVKAILQYTAEFYAGHSFIAQGAGFLNAMGAVDLARAFNLPREQRGPAPAGWSAHLIWGNRLARGGELLSSAGAWDAAVEWGAPTTSSGQPMTWGVVCSGPSCETADSAWSDWGARCAGPECDTIVWGSQPAVNVVWGDTCGDGDCEGLVWGTSDDDTVVWGNSEEADTVVWGNSDSDTVVWGNSDSDTVVWGNSDSDTVVWGNSGGDSTCEPVIWGAS
jgi:serine protease AprX